MSGPDVLLHSREQMAILKKRDVAMARSIAASHDLEAQPPDHHVVDLVRTGDVAAFDVLVDRYWDPLTRHLAYRVGDPELGADLAQDAFLDAFRHLDRFDGHRPFAAWLYGIAHNRLRMHWRRQRLRQFVSLEWLTGIMHATPPALQQVDGSAAYHEQDVLFQVLADLTPPLRDALLLHSLDGFTAPEIAEILGISRAAAERRISRAKTQFRQQYRELTNNEEGVTHG